MQCKRQLLDGLSRDALELRVLEDNRNGVRGYDDTVSSHRGRTKRERAPVGRNRRNLSVGLGLDDAYALK